MSAFDPKRTPTLSPQARGEGEVSKKSYHSVMVMAEVVVAIVIVVIVVLVEVE